jgi:hypothetical protein
METADTGPAGASGGRQASRRLLPKKRFASDCVRGPAPLLSPYNPHFSLMVSKPAPCSPPLPQAPQIPELRHPMTRQLSKIIRVNTARPIGGIECYGTNQNHSSKNDSHPSARSNRTTPPENHSSKYGSHPICGIECYDPSKNSAINNQANQNLRPSAPLSATICENPFLSPCEIRVNPFLRHPRKSFSFLPARSPAPPPSPAPIISSPPPNQAAHSPYKYLYCNF